MVLFFILSFHCISASLLSLYDSAVHTVNSSWCFYHIHVFYHCPSTCAEHDVAMHSYGHFTAFSLRLPRCNLCRMLLTAVLSSPFGVNNTALLGPGNGLFDASDLLPGSLTSVLKLAPSYSTCCLRLCISHVLA